MQHKNPKIWTAFIKNGLKPCILFQCLLDCVPRDKKRIYSYFITFRSNRSFFVPDFKIISFFDTFFSLEIYERKWLPRKTKFIAVCVYFSFFVSQQNKHAWKEGKRVQGKSIFIKIGYFIASQRARNLHKLSFVLSASVSAEHKLFVILSDSPIQKQRTAVPNHILRVSCQSNDPQI